MTFDEQVKAFLNTPAMKAKVKAHYKKMGGSAEGEAAAAAYAQEAILAIITSLPASLKRGPRAIKVSDLVASTPILNNNGDYEVELKWNAKAIHRDSLYDADEGYPDGVENIVALFSTGTKPTRHDVFGDHMWGTFWHESSRYFIPQGYSKQSDPFISNAVAAFNAAHEKDGVVLIAPSKYT